MSWFSRLVSRNARRVLDEAHDIVWTVLSNPALVVPDIDRVVDGAIRWAAVRLGIRLSDRDRAWVKSRLDAEAMLQATRELGRNAHDLLDDIARWEREAKP